MRIDSAIITGSFSVNGDTFNDLGSYSTTGSNTFVGNQSIVGAVSASALTGSINFTNLTGVPTLVSGSEQIVGILSPLNSYTQSNDTTNTTQNTRLSNLENKTGSLATTGSNTFIGNQTISGTVYIQNDLIVQGSSSLQNITASAVSIGTNIVNLNTANPSIRFAGLSIVDSGSVGGSGSFLYDSLQDEFIFVHRGAATTVTSSVILMGPQTYDSIGSETYLTNNRLVKGGGNEHLADSNISDTGTLVSVNSPTIFLSGSVGIGTTNPGEKLTINGSIGIQRNGTQIWHTSVDSSNNLQFTRSGIAERMTISSDGLVGIGTMVPSNILHLYGTDGNSYLRWTSNVATTGARIGYNGSEFRIDQQQNADITFRTNGSEKLKIASGGDILISNNGKFLQAVRNTGGAVIDIIGIQSGTDTLQIKGGTSGGVNAINFYDTGGLIGTFYNSNLGIGTATPSSKLEVTGTGRFTGILTSDANISAGTYLGVNRGGSDTIGSGPYLVLSQTAGSRQWIQQMGASLTLDYYHYNGSGWIQPLTLAPSGHITMSASARIAGPLNVGGDTNFYQVLSQDFSYGSGWRELFRIPHIGLCTSGRFSLNGTGNSFVHSSQWAWSSTHNGGTGRTRLVQLTGGEYSDIQFSIDVTGAGDIIINANFGTSYGLNLCVEKTRGGAIDTSNQNGDRTSPVSGYARVQTITSTPYGSQFYRVVAETLAGSGNRAVYSDSGGSLTNSSSDVTLKKNVENIAYGLNSIMALRPISFNWIPEKLGEQKEIGFIAQEVQESIPELIGTNKDETLSLDYPKLTAVLTKAIQELKVENDSLKEILQRNNIN